MVECLTRDRGAAGSSLTSVIALCPWARHINPSLVLVQPRKTRPFITERIKSSKNKHEQCTWFICWQYCSIFLVSDTPTIYSGKSPSLNRTGSPSSMVDLENGTGNGVKYYHLVSVTSSGRSRGGSGGLLDQIISFSWGYIRNNEVKSTNWTPLFTFEPPETVMCSYETDLGH